MSASLQRRVMLWKNRATAWREGAAQAANDDKRLLLAQANLTDHAALELTRDCQLLRAQLREDLAVARYYLEHLRVGTKDVTPGALADIEASVMRCVKSIDVLLGEGE